MKQQAFSSSGFNCHFVPVLKFGFLNAAELYSILSKDFAESYSGIIVTSSRAVDAIVHAITRDETDTTHSVGIPRVPVFAVGEKTHEAAASAGLHAYLLDGVKDARSLALNLASQWQGDNPHSPFRVSMSSFTHHHIPRGSETSFCKTMNTEEELEQKIISNSSKGTEMESNEDDKQSSTIEVNCTLPLIHLCGDLKLSHLKEVLDGAQIPLHMLDIYETVPSPAPFTEFLTQHKSSDLPNFIVFFSPSGVNTVAQTLQALFKTENGDLYREWWDSRVALCAIGQTTANRAREVGWDVPHVASAPTPASLLDCVLHQE